MCGCVCVCVSVCVLGLIEVDMVKEPTSQFVEKLNISFVSSRKFMRKMSRIVELMAIRPLLIAFGCGL